MTIHPAEYYERQPGTTTLSAKRSLAIVSIPNEAFTLRVAPVAPIS